MLLHGSRGSCPLFSLADPPPVPPRTPSSASLSPSPSPDVCPTFPSNPIIRALPIQTPSTQTPSSTKARLHNHQPYLRKSPFTCRWFLVEGDETEETEEESDREMASATKVDVASMTTSRRKSNSTPPGISVEEVVGKHLFSVDEECRHADPTRPLDESHQPKNLKIYTGSLMKTLSATDLSRELHEPKLLAGKALAPSIGESRVLVLYTGGTIGMKSKDGVYSPQAGYLPEVIRNIPPLNDRDFIDEFYAESTVIPYSLPPIRNMKKRVIYWIVEYEPLLDSCDMTFDDWIRIATDIRKAYHHYDGFVVLHGTDTLAYTASALSFMMENLGKPVVITGSQIPVAEVRSDGMDNLIGALVTAGNLDIPEVCVYFNNKLLRGNRTVKTDNSALAAFDSPNMEPLARMNINIKVNYDSIFRSDSVAPFAVHDNLCRDVGMLRIFPSMSIDSVRAFLQTPAQGVILQTFGAGNMPTRRTDIIEALKEAIDRGVLIVNTTQCLKGQVDMHYATGKVLYDIGVIPGSDMTAEGAMAKMCYVLGKTEWNHDTKNQMLQSNLRGEMSVTRKGEGKQLDIIPQIARALRLGTTKEIVAVKGALMPPLVCHAAKSNDIALLEQLKESGAVFSLPDYNLRTALHVAASSGNTEAVAYLLQIGVNVHTKDMWGYTPLMCAVRSSCIDCIEAIRQAGGVLDGDPQQNGMELCFAASKGDVATLRAYSAAGADMQAVDYDGRTPLHVAVAQNRVEALDFLLSIPVQPNVKDSNGRTPLDEARRLELTDLSERLVAAETEWAERVRRQQEDEEAAAVCSDPSAHHPE